MGEVVSCFQMTSLKCEILGEQYRNWNVYEAVECQTAHGSTEKEKYRSGYSGLTPEKCWLKTLRVNSAWIF